MTALSERKFPKKQRPFIGEDGRVKKLPPTQKERIGIIKKLIQCLDDSEAQIQSLSKEIASHSDDYIEHQLHLKEITFIPEYLGFKDEVVKFDEGPAVRVYYRQQDGIMMTRADDTRWTIVTHQFGDMVKALVKFNNMFEAVIMLKAMGMDVDRALAEETEREMQSVNEVTVHEKLKELQAKE